MTEPWRSARLQKLEMVGDERESVDCGELDAGGAALAMVAVGVFEATLRASSTHVASDRIPAAGTAESVRAPAGRYENTFHIEGVAFLSWLAGSAAAGIIGVQQLLVVGALQHAIVDLLLLRRELTKDDVVVLFRQLVAQDLLEALQHPAVRVCAGWRG